MATNYLTPNMNLTVPVVGAEPGPAWASDINSSLTVVDAHTHNPGSGIQITPTGININADLAFNTNNAISLRSARFFVQAAALTGGADLACAYSAPTATGDLWWNDGLGNNIRITQSGAVAGASGTITGLPSGTASAAFDPTSGTFIFQQATSTAANLDVGSVIVRYPGSYPSPGGNAIVLEAPSSLSSVYSLTLPSLPTQTNVMILGGSGIISSITFDQVGQSMGATGANSIAANITGNINTPGTITADTITGATLVLGATINAGNLNASGSLSVNNGVSCGNISSSGTLSVAGNTTFSSASVTIGSKFPAVTQFASSTYSLGIIRGTISAGGSVTGGEGFSVTSPSSGLYNLTFTTAFADTPAVTANSNQNNLRIMDVVAANNTACTIESGGGATPFSFIAIGRRN